MGQANQDRTQVWQLNTGLQIHLASGPQLLCNNRSDTICTILLFSMRLDLFCSLRGCVYLLSGRAGAFAPQAVLSGGGGPQKEFVASPDHPAYGCFNDKPTVAHLLKGSRAGQPGQVRPTDPTSTRSPST